MSYLWAPSALLSLECTLKSEPHTASQSSWHARSALWACSCFPTQSEIIYKPFNAAARANQAAQYKPYHDILLSAHQKMPLDPQMRLLHRGVAEDLQSLYPPQKQFTWRDFTSWSTNQETAAGFAQRDDGGRSTMFCVHSNMGKCVKKYSEFKKEEEFLLPPNTMFVVKTHDHYTSSTGERHTLVVLEHHDWATPGTTWEGNEMLMSESAFSVSVTADILLSGKTEFCDS